MIIECPSCHSKYQYDEERFERKPSKRIKCARCQHIFEIHNPAFAAKPVVETDSTSTAKGEKTNTARSPKAPDTTEQSPLPEHRMRPGQEAAALQLPAGRRLSLAILDGPDAGSVFRIDKPRVTIGRSNADLTLNDTEASRLHASLEIRDSSISLADLGSTNGTLVNGEKIAEPVELTDKSEFQVGSTLLMLIVTEDA